MAMPIKYKTEEERKEAARKYAKEYAKKRYQIKKQDPEWMNSNREMIRNAASKRRALIKENKETYERFRAYENEKCNISRKRHKERDIEDYWAQRICQTIKARSKKEEIPFDMSKDYLISILPDDRCCPIFKTKFVFGGIDGKPCKESPSIDRIIPKLGYTKGNIKIISNKANTIKQDVENPEDIIKVAEYLKFELEKTKAL